MTDSAAKIILVNGGPLPWQAGLTVAQLIQSLGMPGSGVAVERHGHVVRRAEQALVVVEPGDQIEVVRLVGGG